MESSHGPSPDKAIQNSTIYPDLDFVPSYPWSWPNNIEECTPSAYPPSEGLGSQNHHEGRGMNAFELAQHDHEMSDSSEKVNENAVSLSNATVDRIDQSMDPDYQVSEGSVVSQDELSADSSDVSALGGSDSALRGKISRGATRGRFRGRGGVRRGHGHGKGAKTRPRRPVDPGPEFKVLQSQAHEAFLEKYYNKAEGLVNRALLVNNEMFSTYSLLSEIYRAQGNEEKSVEILFAGANTRPSDSKLWTRIAQLILDVDEGQRSDYIIKKAIHCYARVIQRDPKNIEVAHQLAVLYLEQKRYKKAIREYERILDISPYDTATLRQLAEVCNLLGEVSTARDRYKKCIAYYMSLGDPVGQPFTWSDANIYIELFGCDRAYEEGIFELKSICRWLLGRGKQTFWNNFQADDREWDSDPQSRCGITIPFDDVNPADYGRGLPLELRIRLGIYRIKADHKNLSEAMGHFNWLFSQEDGPDALLSLYPDLFREVGETLKQEGFPIEALRFFEPLHHKEDYADTLFYLALGDCYRQARLMDEAQQCYRAVVESDEQNTEARVQLAEICELLGQPDQATKYLHEFITINRKHAEIQSRLEHGTSGISSKPQQSAPRFRSETRPSRAKGVKSRVTLNQEQLTTAERDRSNYIKMLYANMQTIHDQMRTGDAVATGQWMEAASILIEDFRSCRALYPLEKYMKFFGYTSDARKQSTRTKASEAMAKMEALAGRLKASMSKGSSHPALEPSIPTDYRGISFEPWLDIFLEYALYKSEVCERAFTYDIITAAADASVFHHSRDSMFLIHVCWFTCALRYDDDETLCSIARWFIKEFQFTSDAYRLYAALNRLCRSPTSWYTSGPSLKYTLRQLKAMDFSLVDEDIRRSIFTEKAGYSTKDEHGKTIKAEELDSALLTLYGYMLYTGANYTCAMRDELLRFWSNIDYFLRAYALDPDNPTLNFTLGLSFIHWALKRQAENRHYLIIQGFSFLFAYYNQRRSSAVAQEKQEAEFNLARAFHLLGLLHLATPHYERCITYSAEIDGKASEDFAMEAALALQIIFATTGDLEAAQKITNKYLVI